MITTFGGLVINLDKVLYGIVREYDGNDKGYTVRRWKFTLYLEDGKEIFWGGFENKVDAEQHRDEFQHHVDRLTYVIQEPAFP